MKLEKSKQIPINETKKKKNQKKQKEQKCRKHRKNDNALKTKQNQCPKCGNWFTLCNDIFNIHLTQCHILQQSLAMNIHQEEESSSSYYSPLHEMMTNATTKQRNQRQTGSNDHSYKVADFGCFTERLSRIDLKRSSIRIEKKTFDDSMTTDSQPLPAHQRQETDDNNDKYASGDETIDSKYNSSNYEDMYEAYEKAWALFENVASKAYSTKARLSAECIPFPSKLFEHNDGNICSFGLSSEMSLNLKRVRIRQLLMRWYESP